MVRIVLGSDVALFQDSVSGAVAADPDYCLAGAAYTPRRCVAMTKSLRPDIVVMAWRNHAADGAEAVARIMAESPTPIVVLFDDPESEPILISGELTAMQLPDLSRPEEVRRFLTGLAAMSQVKVVRRYGYDSRSAVPDERQSAIVAVAASTGGPQALKTFLGGLPAEFPVPVLVVQHISAGFTEGVAKWLSSEVSIKVKVAEDQERMLAGTAYFAPDGFHIGVSGRGRISLSAEAPVQGFRPSGTYLFESVSKAFGPDALAVVLTGMGEDGLAGAILVHERGGRVIAQNAETSVVFGMPQAVIAAGVADFVLPIAQIARTVQALVHEVKKRPRQ